MANTDFSFFSYEMGMKSLKDFSRMLEMTTNMFKRCKMLYISVWGYVTLQ